MGCAGHITWQLEVLHIILCTRTYKPVLNLLAPYYLAAKMNCWTDDLKRPSAGYMPAHLVTCTSTFESCQARVLHTKEKYE